MELVKYVHLERFGTDEVDGINIGECYIFPKIDGTNASVWRDDDKMQCGSRNRVLSLDDDNAGFMAWAVQQDNLHALIAEHPNLRFYGEWLVPHSLKTYRDDAWRKFYVFDVLDMLSGEFLHYDVYSEMLKLMNVDFIPCMTKAVNPTYEVLIGATQRNTYLLRENAGVGEGVVIKQYGWKNRFARTTWAKLITNTFKDQHVKEMGGSLVNTKLIEEEIADEFVSPHLVDKIISKIRNDQGQFSARHIPQLLGMAFHDLVSEEMWEAVKKHKSPRIDFRTLNHCTIRRVKQLKPELFGVAA